MIDQLREKIFDWCLRHQAKREVVMYAWKDIRSVVILHDEVDVKHIAKQLQREGKEVQMWSMPEKKDICWLTGMPKKEVREEVQSRHYDLMIDLTQQPNITMQYMAMYMKAGIKTGRDIGKRLYDLSIDTPAQQTPDFLFEQVVKYIQMFTQKRS